MKNVRLGKFLNKLERFHSPNVFNPYRDTCSIHDLEEAPRKRLDMLRLVLDAAMRDSVEYLWIGRDLGHRGGRRTGLALTDEVHLANVSKKWNINIAKSTKGGNVAERTAKVIWSELDKLENDVFLWNIFPFHPYEQRNQFTNRSHNASERKIGEELLKDVVDLVNPRLIIAIGNDAFNSSTRLFDSNTVKKVRHPSYGGEKDFRLQLSRIISCL